MVLIRVLFSFLKLESPSWSSAFKDENGNFWASTCVTQLYSKLESPAEQIVDDVIHQAQQYPGKHHSAPLNLVFLTGNPLNLLNCKFSGNLSSWFCLWSCFIKLFFSFPASSRCNTTRVQVRTPYTCIYSNPALFKAGGPVKTNWQVGQWLKLP